MSKLIFVIGFLLILLGVALLIAKTVAHAKKVDRHERYGTTDPGSFKRPKSTTALAIIGVVCIVLSSCFEIIPTGYTGVRTTFGLIDQESCQSGFNPLIPYIQEISLVNNKQQDLRFTERIWSETKEQTVLFMENVVVTYQIVPEASAWIYANVENWIQELIDQDMVSSSLKAASRQIGADVVTDRSIIEPAGQVELQRAVDEKYGEGRVVIKKVIINNMDFEDSYNAAIARKSEAIQQQQEQAIRNETNIKQAEAEAEAARKTAQGKADAALIEAQARAEATLAEADAKAQANEKVASSITDAIQLQDTIKKWDGALPKYTGSNSALFGILDSN